MLHYQVVIGCIIPIITRGLAKIRLSHLFMMYVFRHRLNIDMAASRPFHYNVQFILFQCVSLHRPFHYPSTRQNSHASSHIITTWIASLGIDVSRSTIKHLFKKYDPIELQNFSLAKMTKRFMPMVWADEHNAGEDDDDDDDEEVAQLPLGQPMGISDRLEHVETMITEGLA